MATETSGLRQGLLSGRKSVSPPAMSVAQHDPKAIATHGVVNSLQSPTPMKGKGKGKGKAGFVEAAPTSKKRLTYGPWSVLLPIMSCIYDDRWIHLCFIFTFSILFSPSFFLKKKLKCKRVYIRSCGRIPSNCAQTWSGSCAYSATVVAAAPSAFIGQSRHYIFIYYPPEVFSKIYLFNLTFSPSPNA